MSPWSSKKHKLQMLLKRLIVSFWQLCNQSVDLVHHRGRAADIVVDVSRQRIQQRGRPYVIANLHGREGLVVEVD